MTESVFERLSRRQTAASIGQQVASRRQQSTANHNQRSPPAQRKTTTTTTPIRRKTTPSKTRRPTQQPRTRVPPQQQRRSEPTPRSMPKMTTDMRLSLLDDLEEAEQTFLEKEESGGSSEVELDDLLGKEAKETKVSKTASPKKAKNDAFNRFHQKETKASIGQQVASSSPKRKQNSPGSSQASTTIQRKTPADSARYSITKSEMASQALKEITKAATALSIRQLRLVSMKESFDLPFLTQFYNDLMIPNFPLEDERDDLEDWVHCLDPANQDKVESEQGPSMDVLLLVGTPSNSKENSPVIIGGIAFEYYRQAQTGLLSYMVVADDFRRLGILRSLHPVACQAMQQLHLVSIQQQREQSRNKNTTFSPNIKAIFAETNTADAGDASPEVIQKRHKILRRLGYRHLKFPYVQPPLAEDAESFDDIMLLIYSGTNVGNEPATTIDTEVLFKYVVDFYQSVTGYDNDKYKKHWYFKLVEWYLKRYPRSDISMEVPWHDVTAELQLAMEKESQRQTSMMSPIKTKLDTPGRTVEPAYRVQRIAHANSATVRLPPKGLSPCSSTDDSSISADYSNGTPESPDSSSSAQSYASPSDLGLASLLFPSNSSCFKAPWKMALSRKDTYSSKDEALYIRSMSNLLYDFGNGQASETEVAEALITALFHRDYERGKFWNEREATVIEKDGVKHCYTVQKAVESSEVRGVPRKTVFAAEIHFDHSKRVVRVNEYQQSLEDKSITAAQ